MTADRLSAVLSLLAAIAVVSASFFKWWTVTYDGLRTHKWVKFLLTGALVLLAGALGLLLFSE